MVMNAAIKDVSAIVVFLLKEKYFSKKSLK